MDNAKEKFAFRAIANRHTAVAMKRFAAVFADGETAKNVELDLSAQLVAGVVKEYLAATLHYRAGHHTILVEGAGSPDVQDRLARHAQHFGRIVGIHIHVANS